MNLYRRGKYWWADLRGLGFDRISTKEEDKRSARAFVLSFLAKHHIDPGIKTGSLEELIERFLDWSRSYHAPQVYDLNCRILDLFLKFCGEKINLYSIHDHTVEAFYFHLLKSVQPITANRYMQIVKFLFNRAVEWKWIMISPAANVKLRPTTQKLREYFTVEQVNRIIESDVDPWKAYWEILAYSGIRTGEIDRLTWNDIRDGFFWIHQTKEKKPKKVPISERCQLAIDRLTPTSGRLLYCTRIQMRMRLVRHLARLGIKGGPHKFRHTFVNNLLMAGVPIHVVSKLVGHAKISTTQIYTNATEYDLKSAVEKIFTSSALVSSLTRDPMPQSRSEGSE